MGFLFSGIFWGIVLVLLGISVLAKVFFNVDIPIFRILFGLILIYIGLRVMLGPCCSRSVKNTVVFNDAAVKSGNEDAYRVVFGKGDFDLTDRKPSEDGSAAVDVQTVFGSSTVRLNPAVPTRVRANAVFAAVRMPDKQTAAMGTSVYRNAAYREGQPAVEVNVHAVFGEITIVEEKR